MKIVQCLGCGEVLYCLSPHEIHQCNCSNLAYLSGIRRQKYGAVDLNKLKVFEIGRVYITGHDLDISGRQPLERWMRKHKVPILVIQGREFYDFKYMFVYDLKHPRYMRRVEFD